MTLGSLRPVLLFTVCTALASSTAIGLSSCGGGSSGARPGTGSGGSNVTGTGGAGGSAAGGGTGGGAVVPGTGGTSGCATPLASYGPWMCGQAVTPTDPVLTDFTPATWRNTEGKWGCGALTGGLFHYAGPSSTMDTQVDLMNHDLVLVGKVASGDYAGGGLAFGPCVNASTYTGVQFTLGGTAAGCDLYFQVQTYDAQGSANGGGCAADGGVGCYSFPQYKVPSPNGQVMVHFSDLTGGMPVGAAALSAQMVGLQWQLNSPPPPAVDGGLQVSCDNISLTITGVKFIQ